MSIDLYRDAALTHLVLSASSTLTGAMRGHFVALCRSAHRLDLNGVGKSDARLIGVSSDAAPEGSKRHTRFRCARRLRRGNCAVERAISGSQTEMRKGLRPLQLPPPDPPERSPTGSGVERGGTCLSVCVCEWGVWVRFSCVPPEGRSVQVGHVIVGGVDTHVRVCV